MNRFIEIHRSKCLRLDNVLINELINISLAEETSVLAKAEDEDNEKQFSLGLEVEKMNNEIMTKGAKQIGPLIQYSGTRAEQDELEVKICLMMQADRYISNVQPPYRMEPVINVKDCMYTRFKGYEDDMQYAYQKIQVDAYENDIKLKGNSYTIFLETDENGIMTADIFMEKENA